MGNLMRTAAIAAGITTTVVIVNHQLYDWSPMMTLTGMALAWIAVVAMR